MTVAQAFPEVAREMHDFFASVYATGEPVRLRQFRVPMGETLTWWDADFLPLNADSGQVSRILIIGHQITEVMEGRRKAEAEALKNRAVIDNLAEGLVLANARGDILHVNPAAMHIYGMRSTEEIPAPSGASTASWNSACRTVRSCPPRPGPWPGPCAGTCSPAWRCGPGARTPDGPGWPATAAPR